jgi:uncharacterized membrane protein
VALLSFAIAGYALAYVVIGPPMYPPNLADSFRARPWGIYPHVFFGMIALALGPFQFRRGVVLHRRELHRTLGRIYVAAALVTGIAGLYMSAYSYGGMVTHIGFGLLAAGLILTTAAAYVRIRQGRIAAHREWVIRSFALLFSAVTLRLWLPILIGMFQGFDPAYAVVSWLCWVPNLLSVELYLLVTRSREPLRFLTS